MAARVLMSLEDVTLSFGGKPLFENIRLHINEGDRICLVGKNGAGKTTLMRMIMGELELDRGERFTLPGLTIGYLAQKVECNPESTIMDFVLYGLRTKEEREHGHHLAERMMTPLELDPSAQMKTLSGGQLRRASLAQALIAEPSILLLDEPTNHLDIKGIEWLERYLATYRGALLCVSHDRTFLANISRKVFWIDRGQIRTCPKGYAEFDEWAEVIMQQELRALQNMQKKLIEEEAWTQGGVSARRKRNQRRMRELHRLRDKIRVDKAAYKMGMRKVEIDSLTPTQASKLIAEFKHVHKSFAKPDGTMHPILKDFNFRVQRGDRIGILGRNGSGKSTFLKLLAGELEADTGNIRRGKTIRVSYFDQNRTAIDPDATLWSTLCPDGGDHVFLGDGEERKPIHVCGYLKRFLFDPKSARDKVGTLSGGQQNRLLLAKVLADPGNVLILDEPTNDLDMDTLDMLQEVLADYAGTLLLVSHDRDFLDRTVTEVLAFEGEAKIDHCIGGYSDYIEFKQKREGGKPPKKSTLLSFADDPNAPKKGSNRYAQPAKDRAESPDPEGVEFAAAAPAQSKPLRMSYKHKHELEKLPDRIAALEEELAGLRTLLDDPSLYMKDPENFDKSTRRFAKAQSELEMAELRWLELEEMRAASE